MARTILAPKFEGRRIDADLLRLAELPKGWHDGEGAAFSREGLLWLAEAWRRNVPASLPAPGFGPTVEGMVRAEWPMRPWDASLEIDLSTRLGYFHALDLETDEDIERDGLDLGSEHGWAELVRLLEPLV